MTNRDCAVNVFIYDCLHNHALKSRAQCVFIATTTGTGTITLWYRDKYIVN